MLKWYTIYKKKNEESLTTKLWGRVAECSDLTLPPFLCLTQTPTCFPCLLSSLAREVLIVDPNPSLLWPVECEIMCFNKYCGCHCLYTSLCDVVAKSHYFDPLKCVSHSMCSETTENIQEVWLCNMHLLQLKCTLSTHGVKGPFHWRSETVFTGKSSTLKTTT